MNTLLIMIFFDNINILNFFYSIYTMDYSINLIWLFVYYCLLVLSYYAFLHADPEIKYKSTVYNDNFSQI